MFSGIVESVMPIISSKELHNAYRIEIKKPSEFNDIKLGDSIACDGVCLTVEAFDEVTMTFALAAETIQVLQWNPQTWLGKKVNLERSLRFGDRIHGHLVTGHVDSLGKVTRAELLGESFFLDVKVAETVLPFVWKKGSVTLNGVSLTVNALEGDIVSVCLIPETLKRTNLGDLKPGSMINVEPDYMARAIQRSLEVRKD
ncbi:riboflavin synthase [Bdellovibrio reynosensis]|uniref:Riboflavin synthase n=1 Tax=Bdellovibrio reynosensis TaxID=2835041 RepID=A0ABY4C857_9BACT|nr:riboflavin synthase [Bdellovibrio reynosensis]UOF01176.1 riboflavin synthase [Bdellovibrio reynosensis]